MCQINKNQVCFTNIFFCSKIINISGEMNDRKNKSGNRQIEK